MVNSCKSELISFSFRSLFPERKEWDEEDPAESENGRRQKRDNELDGLVLYLDIVELFLKMFQITENNDPGGQTADRGDRLIDKRKIIKEFIHIGASSS